MPQPWDYIAKVVNIGDSGCGKSSLTIRLCEGRFNPAHDVTIGVEFGSRIIPVSPDKKIKLQIWDTAGQESFRAITKSYFRGATGALLVYDITRRETFDHVKTWLEELRGAADKDISIILVGNKCDLAEEGKRAVTKEEAQEWARENGLKAAVETSAKTGEAVEQAFVDCAKEIWKNIESGVYDLNDKSHGIKANTAKSNIGIEDGGQAAPRGGCC
ncbi:P-loop containing nucleoside triphosphate hydrolase protein [Sphaerosporella brunnea]|uniref:P-loop containing nucleoside triphosphate hydrolase protein n=1 Tax=Sphaerosporella brunnea TaxID=1250544 RepID=A0A5J5EGY5_9PEZI|nr:P-loop containing nucleoside triphosphate hydrolase protein [Sphaerosporella brunnea]